MLGSTSSSGPRFEGSQRSDGPPRTLVESPEPEKEDALHTGACEVEIGVDRRVLFRSGNNWEPGTWDWGKSGPTGGGPGMCPESFEGRPRKGPEPRRNLSGKGRVHLGPLNPRPPLNCLSDVLCVPGPVSLTCLWDGRVHPPGPGSLRVRDEVETSTKSPGNEMYLGFRLVNLSVL